MTYRFTIHFLLGMEEGCIGPFVEGDRSSETLEYVESFLHIVVTSLGAQEAGVWFAAAGRASARERSARAAHFGFAHYLSVELGTVEETVSRVAAWQALLAVRNMLDRTGAEVEHVMDCAIRAAQKIDRRKKPTNALTTIVARQEPPPSGVRFGTGVTLAPRRALRPTGPDAAPPGARMAHGGLVEFTLVSGWLSSLASIS